MDITPTTLILVGVVCVFLGYLASVLMNTLADDGDVSAEVTVEAPPGGRKGRYTPVFRVWRDKGAGSLVVEMDGKSMVAPDPLNAEQRERLEQAVRDLRGWLGMGLAAARGEERVEVFQPEPSLPTDAEEIDLNRAFTNIPASTPPKPAAPAARQPSAFSNPAAAQRSTAAQSPALKGKEEPILPATKSIAMQIEDILQDMIAGTDLAERGVHLMDDPVKGVIVKVGIEQFEGIESVPYPRIKGIIQSAVQEWEKSQ